MLDSIFLRLVALATLVSLVSTALFLLYAVATHLRVYYTIGLYALYLSVACQVIGGFTLLAQWVRSKEAGKKPRQLVLLVLGIIPFGFIPAIAIILAQYLIQRTRLQQAAQRQALNQGLRSDLKDQGVDTFTGQLNDASQNAANSRAPTVKSTIRDLAGPDAERSLSSRSNGLVAIAMCIVLVAMLVDLTVAIPGSSKGGASGGSSSATGNTGQSGTSHPKSHLPSGTTKIFALPNNLLPVTIVGGPDGNVWFTGTTDTSGAPSVAGYITPSGTIHDFPTPESAGFPTGSMAVGPDKALWFTLAFNGTPESTSIGRITTSGSFQSFQTPEGLGVYGNINIVCGLTAGPDGNLWFSEQYTNKIARITPSGTITEFSDPSTDGFPTAITAGADGNLWFSDKDGLGKISPSGSTTLYPFSGGAQCLTAGPDQKVWFTDGNGNIDSVTSDGTITTVATGVGGGCITTDSNGNLWFTGNGNVIDRMTPNGAMKSYPISGTTDSLQCLTVGPDGNIWFITQSQLGDTGSIGYVAP